ncbi:10505_t:CDS:2, partial [Gigaspora rosea]
MSQRNQGPCKVTDCNSDNVIRYHKFTTKAMEKSIAKNTFNKCNYLKIDDQLCHMHYLNIVEPDRNNKGKLAELITNKKIHEIFTLSEENTMHIFNIDDYHSIHSYKRSDIMALSNAHHMATCVAKKIKNCLPILAIFNNISFFNPQNIDASLINKYLLGKYNGNLDISYNAQKFHWTNQNIQKFQHFDRIELLTIHIYDDAI